MPTPPPSSPEIALRDLWRSMVVRPETSLMLPGTARAIDEARARYEEVSRATGVPWTVIGILHQLECGGSFSCHLHNGDSLNARTVNVPRGRPATGNPPFRWADSAADALRFDKLDRVDWTRIGSALAALEKYNGLGYRRRGLHSPYLWSGTNHYQRGKFVADGRFDPNAVSRQVGAAPLLQWFVGHHLLSLQT